MATDMHIDSGNIGSAAASSAGWMPVDAEAAAQRPETRPVSTTDFAQTAGKVIDLKGLIKPEVFAGQEAQWQECRFKQDTVYRLVGLEEFAKWALEVGEAELEHEVLPDGVEAASKFMHSTHQQLQRQGADFGALGWR